MGVFDNAIQTAKKLIAKNGEISTIRRTVPGVRPVPDLEPWKPALPTTSNIPVTAVWLNYSLRDSGNMDDPGTLIKVGDKKVFIAALDISTITSSDSIVRADGELYEVANVKLLDPNGQRILYELQVRK